MTFAVPLTVYPSFGSRNLLELLCNLGFLCELLTLLDCSDSTRRGTIWDVGRTSPTTPLALVTFLVL
jgi:hypothetical protein